jgi:hypothetical protein
VKLNIDFNSIEMRPRAPRVLAIAALVAACSKPVEAPAPSPSPSAVASAENPAEALASLTAMIKLVAQEYVLAVDDRGAVTNVTELNEADLFADQAKFRYQRVAPQVKAAPEAVRAAGGAIDALAAAVVARKPPGEVQKLSQGAAEALLALGPAESAATAGLRAAEAQADRNVTAEQAALDYRIGVFTEPPRRMYRRDGEGVPRELGLTPGATAFLGVVLREQRTKRFLPDAGVSVRFVAADGTSSGAIPLAPLWGDYPLYGANVAVPAGALARLEVHVEPPHHARHGDMLAHVAKPADASFTLAGDAQGIHFDPAPPQPIAGDYKLGDDILQGFGEARFAATDGDYHIGFISEPPEPFWLWKDGLELKAVKPTDTHHLEVVLQDRKTGLLVPDAGVTLTLTPKQGQPIVARLHGLLSEFQHYGETLKVPPGDYRVRIDVEPPPTDVLDTPRVLGTARVEADWRAEPAPQGEK